MPENSWESILGGPHVWVPEKKRDYEWNWKWFHTLYERSVHFRSLTPGWIWISRKINESQTKKKLRVESSRLLSEKPQFTALLAAAGRKFDRYQFVASSNRLKGRSDKSQIEILMAYEEVKSEFWSSCDARARSIHSVCFTHNRLFFISRSLNDWFAFGNAQSVSWVHRWVMQFRWERSENSCESERWGRVEASVELWQRGRDLERQFSGDCRT